MTVIKMTQATIGQMQCPDCTWIFANKTVMPCKTHQDEKE